MEHFLAFWDQGHTPLRILLILVGTVLVRLILLILVKRVIRGIEDGTRNHKSSKSDSPIAKARVVQRAKTMGSVLSNLITWTLILFAVGSVLSELGIAVGALIASAGILGAALGFGAQSLVRDLISGMFIIFEDQFGVGDSVDLGQANGVIETVGLRVTQVRDVTGTLWYVRNGEITRVGNHTQGWSRVILDIALPYDTKLDKARAAILDAANALVKDNTFSKRMLGNPEIWGIEAINGRQVVLRLVQQVGPQDADEVARELRLRVKESLDKAKLSLADTPLYVEVAGKAVK
ncbi:MAG: mechanosensitive ion channel family protein [Micrococcales bacterium]